MLHLEDTKMEYVYTAMLLHKAGKDITEDTVKAVLTAAGVTVDESRVKALVAALEGVDIADAIKNAALAAPAAAAGDAPKDDKKDEKKAAEDDKKAEESAAAGLGALFG